MGALQNLVDDRILLTDTSRRLVSEAKSALYGFTNYLNKIETHYITANSNGMSLPHAFSSEGDIICLGLQGIGDTKVREDVVNFNASNGGDTTEKEDGFTDNDGKNMVSEKPSESVIQEK